MKTQSKPTTLPRIVLDADPVLRGMRLPYFTLATFREMKLGEQIQLLNFGGPGYGEENEGGAVAIVTRMRGGFELDACWALDVGKNARKRGHTLVDLRFKILPNRRIELLPSTHAREVDQRQLCLNLTMKVLRRASLLGRWARASGDLRASAAMQPNCYRTTNKNRYSDASQWLQGLSGIAR